MRFTGIRRAQYPLFELAENAPGRGLSPPSCQPSGGCSFITVGIRVIGMIFELIWINGPGRDLPQFRGWRCLDWGGLGQLRFSE